MRPHLNLNVRRTKRSATLAINERSAALAARGKTIYRLGLGQSPFPVPDFVVEELKRNAHQKDYLPVAGLAELREAVAGFHNRQDGTSADANDVLIGPGSKELLFLAQLCYNGELLLPSPSWVSYQPQAFLLGLPTNWIPTTIENGWRLTADALRSVCTNDPTRPRVLILNYPNNPAGTTIAPDELYEIAKVCREFNILVLSDEIYGEVHHSGAHRSIAHYYREGTVISNGLSKWCGAGGWRVGTFVFPKELNWLREAMSVVASETYTSVSAPIQWAAIAAYQDRPERSDYLERSRQVLAHVGRVSHQQLTKAGLEAPYPDGGFYLFPSADPLRERLLAKGLMSSPVFCEALLENTGVAVLPGVDFGRPETEFTFRMATVNFDGRKALEAVGDHGDDSESFVRAHCPLLWEALQRLGEWLQ